MSEFFLELFSEEMPSSLQRNARENLLKKFCEFFSINNIEYKNPNTFSTPNRLIIYFQSINKEMIQPSLEIRGPNVQSNNQALDGFVKSNKIDLAKVYKKKTDKGEFYFFKKQKNIIKTHNLLEKEIPLILKKLQWKKAMKWSDFDLYWGRPLKSIFCIYDKKLVNFSLHHLSSTTKVIVDREFEEKTRSFNCSKDYFDFFKKNRILIDQNQRKEFIRKEIQKNVNKLNLVTTIDENLLEEVTNLVESPSLINCTFNEKFLEIPEEILATTMKNHQKYFFTKNRKNEITNNFFLVSNKVDTKGFIKSGNERVIDARFSDANFFWKKNKKNNLLKQIANLKKVNYFKNLGSYFNKITRMRKLGSIISDELLISKEKVEISCTISKVDLLSDLVNEFPELQGILGGYFASEQGFDKDVCLALKEQYLPLGARTKIPKKNYSVALSLADKIDTLVGFFAINMKPTGSKDPFALKRIGLGLIRIVIENNLELKIANLIDRSIITYKEDNIIIENHTVHYDIKNFLIERLKYYIKEKEIRPDIFAASLKLFNLNNINLTYKKSLLLNKYLKDEKGEDLISSYKRAFNILESEKDASNKKFSDELDVGLLKNEYEKNLYKKILELKDVTSKLIQNGDFLTVLENLSGSKKVIYEFFDNVQVNAEDQNLRKNRLELIRMLCKTFDNFIGFSEIENNT